MDLRLKLKVFKRFELLYKQENINVGSIVYL